MIFNPPFFDSGPSVGGLFRILKQTSPEAIV